MDLKAQRAAALKAAQDIAEAAHAAARSLTDDEARTVEEKLSEVDRIDKQLADGRKSDELMQRLTGYGTGDSGDQDSRELAKSGDPSGLHIGRPADLFLKSDGMQALRKQYSAAALRDTKNPIHVEAKGVGGLADLGIGRVKEIQPGLTLTVQQETNPGQQNPTVLPGYRNTMLDDPFTFLDLITTGTTDAVWLQYMQIISETDNAAIVPEGALKPISSVQTDRAEAKAHVYADGFEVTNQTLADDGALVAFMDSRIRRHVRGVVEDTILNGDATANVEGILNTTGTQAQDFDTDVVTTLARALEKVENVDAEPEAIVMHPSDAWKLSLAKDGQGNFMLGNPLQQSLNPTPFGVRLVKSRRVAQGTALVGRFDSVQFLQREALSVVAFNQHKDFAQRNMSYVRAELRGMQLFYAPREIVVTSLAPVAP